MMKAEAMLGLVHLQAQVQPGLVSVQAQAGPCLFAIRPGSSTARPDHIMSPSYAWGEKTFFPETSGQSALFVLLFVRVSLHRPLRWLSCIIMRNNASRCIIHQDMHKIQTCQQKTVFASPVPWPSSIAEEKKKRGRIKAKHKT